MSDANRVLAVIDLARELQKAMSEPDTDWQCADEKCNTFMKEEATQCACGKPRTWRPEPIGFRKKPA